MLRHFFPTLEKPVEHRRYVNIEPERSDFGGVGAVLVLAAFCGVALALWEPSPQLSSPFVTASASRSGVSPSVKVASRQPVAPVAAEDDQPTPTVKLSAACAQRATARRDCANAKAFKEARLNAPEPAATDAMAMVAPVEPVYAPDPRIAKDRTPAIANAVKETPALKDTAAIKEIATIRESAAVNETAGIKETAAVKQTAGVKEPAAIKEIVPVREVASAPVKELANAPVKEMAGAPVKEVATAPVREATNIPVKEVASAAAKEATGTSVKEAPIAPVKEVASGPVKESANTPTEATPAAPATMAAAEVPEAKPQRAASTPKAKKARTTEEAPMERLVKVYDQIMPDGRRVPVYLRAGTGALEMGSVVDGEYRTSANRRAHLDRPGERYFGLQ